MENILNTAAETVLGAGDIAATLITAMIFGIAVAITYMYTCRGRHSQSFVITIVMLPVILSMIIIFVGSNIARAFSLAGTLTIIRFRSEQGSARDIGYVFFSAAAGLAAGVGLYAYGAVFVAALCIFMIILYKTNFGRPSSRKKTLRITVPEDMDFEGAFDGALRKYTDYFELVQVRTINLGSLYEVDYNVTLSRGTSEKELIDELRCMNGNLTIRLSPQLDILGAR